jgi:riboflavin synthase
MFTGIVEAVGKVVAVRPGASTRELVVEVPSGFLDGVAVGASIAVDGACLTPVRVEETGFTVEVIGTTLSRTIAGGYGPGSRVNLERALALGSRLDGHLVQGHVDGIGHLRYVQEDGDFRRLRFQVPQEVRDLTLRHGSIALNGVSLTVNDLGLGPEVEVGIIPHTWSHTNLSRLSPGDPVNVEGDLIGKYVGTLLARGRGPTAGTEPGPQEGGSGEDITPGRTGLSGTSD